MLMRGTCDRVKYFIKTSLNDEANKNNGIYNILDYADVH